MRSGSPFPEKDGWSLLYRIYERSFLLVPPLDRLVRAYFRTKPLERWGDGRLFRLLGVHWFGRFIPTGGIAVRRLTGLPMPPYTLRGTSLRAAREFHYRTICFEACHTPFMAFLFGWAAYQYSRGRVDLMLEDLAVNLVVNVYPILHHRHTRFRIGRLVSRAARRRDARAAAGGS